MTESSPNAGISPLDEAHRLAQAGEPTDALRLTCALLETDPLDHGALLLASELVRESHVDAARRGAERLVDAFVRRGDLPSSVVAAQMAHAAGASLSTLLGTIAEAFSAQSPRLAATSATPPPLPRAAGESASLARMSQTDLAKVASKSIERFLASEDSLPPDGPVPHVPLFSAMSMPSLARLLHCLKVRDVAAGDEVITQGSEGTEAYLVVRGMLEAVRLQQDVETRLAAFGPGSILGEMALVSDTPRAASVRAVEGSRLLVMPKDKLEAEANTEPAIARELGVFCRERMVANVVRHSPILGAVDATDRETLISKFTTRSFDAGRRLVRRDEEAPGLFIIASGHVAVEGEEADGDRIRLAELGPGDVVGEISLILRRPATADVVAIHPTVALHLSREGFQDAIREHPALLSELYELATSRDDETQSVVGQQALDVDDVCLL